MAERAPDEIAAYAELPIMIFIDGYAAQIASMKPSKDQDGANCWEMIINPNDLLVKRYNIRRNEKGNFLQTFKIPHDMIVQLNADPAHTRWLSLQTYNAEQTYVSDLLKGISQQKELELLKKQIIKERTRAEIANEKVNLMQNNLPKYIAKNFNPIMEATLPMIEKLTGKKENQ